MLNPPKTIKQAKEYGYVKAVTHFNESQCAYACKSYTLSKLANKYLEDQCFRKPGHGPGNLYCKQHAKMVEGK